MLYNKNMRYFLFLAAVFVTIAHSAFAQFPSVQRVQNHVQISLLPAQDAIVPGQEFDLAIIQEIPEGWHTYWINPGDSGAESRFEFEMPDGFAVTDLQWPAPERIPYDILMNFGYEDQAAFKATIRAPENLDAYFVTIALNASWLVCNDICIPENERIEITLPVQSTAAPNEPAFFDTANEAFPIFKQTDALYREDRDTFILSIPRSDFQDDIFSAFFPYDYGLIQNAPDQTIVSSPERIVFSAPRGDRKLSEVGNSDFLLISQKGSYRITAMAYATKTAMPSPPPAQENKSGFLYHVLLALFGGIILNLMPCVFPVLSLKALSVVNLKGTQKADIILHGLLYTAGILISFGIFAAFILALRQTGTALGWGFHLQNPSVILFLTYLMTAIGLNLMGAFTIAGRFMNWGQGLGNNKTKTGSFFTGVLAALVATPCTAPFMAAAIGYATIQPALQSMVIFLMVGLGLALPYLLLTTMPDLQKVLPRPGAWMDSFKKFLAVPMFLTSVWLLWVLWQQAGIPALLFAVGGLMILTIALLQKRLSAILTGLVILITLSFFMPQGQAETEETESAWTPQKLVAALETDQPVFVNMTASWCITCKVNENTTLKREQITKLFDDLGMIYLVGDWTNEDATITEYLRSFERNGVPLYVYYPAPENGSRAEPVILPQILTPTIVSNAVQK